MRANFAFTADKEGIRNDDHLSFAHDTYFIVFPSRGRAASGESASYLPFACGARLGSWLGCILRPDRS